MATEANEDAKKLTNELRRYIALYTTDKKLTSSRGPEAS